MGQFDSIIQAATARYKLPDWLLPAVIKQESGGRVDATSPVGAQGLMQLMPATAKALGVTNPNDPGQNIDAGARYLRQQLDTFKTVPLALAAYNAGPGNVQKYGGQIPPFAETQNYVRNIMGYQGSAPAATAVEPTQGAAAVNAPAPAAAPLFPLIDQRTLSLLNQGNQLLGLPKLTLPAQPLAAPTASKGYGAPPTPARTLASRTATVSRDAANLVHLAPNADRPGVSIRPPVVNFVGDIAAIYGKPLTIGTGTNHNEYVKGSRRESAHWTGWAADVPASGETLTRLGYAALLAAGMPPKAAARAAQTGGLFNVNGYQVIFKSNVGGNHWDHLHVGLAPSRQRG